MSGSRPPREKNQHNYAKLTSIGTTEVKTTGVKTSVTPGMSFRETLMTPLKALSTYMLGGASNEVEVKKDLDIKRELKSELNVSSSGDQPEVKEKPIFDFEGNSNASQSSAARSVGESGSGSEVDSEPEGMLHDNGLVDNYYSSNEGTAKSEAEEKALIDLIKQQKRSLEHAKIEKQRRKKVEQARVEQARDTRVLALQEQLKLLKIETATVTKAQGDSKKSSKAPKKSLKAVTPVLEFESDEEEVDIRSLRKREKVVREAERKLQKALSKASGAAVVAGTNPKKGKHKVVEVSDSSSDSDDNESVVVCSSDSEVEVTKPKKKKSGLTAKSTDEVKFPQSYPHCFLSYEYVADKKKFEDLDFRQLVAGELEVIQGNGSIKTVSSVERKGRLALLTKIVYYYNGSNIKPLLDFYANWVGRIELGHNSWADDPSLIENAFSHRIHKQYVGGKVNKKADGKSDSVRSRVDTTSGKLWCGAWNKNKCSKSSPHNATVNGRDRVVYHFCSECYKGDDGVQLKHRECSEECPRR